jgi:hypothetical protein
MEVGVPNSEPGGVAGLRGRAVGSGPQPAGNAPGMRIVRGQPACLSEWARVSREARPGLT